MKLLFKLISNDTNMTIDDIIEGNCKIQKIGNSFHKVIIPFKHIKHPNIQHVGTLPCHDQHFEIFDEPDYRFFVEAYDCPGNYEMPMGRDDINWFRLYIAVSHILEDETGEPEYMPSVFLPVSRTRWIAYLIICDYEDVITDTADILLLEEGWIEGEE